MLKDCIKEVKIYKLSWINIFKEKFMNNQRLKP